MGICLIDTSVFCNILQVPGRDQDRQAVLSEVRAHVEQGTTLLLPMAAIIETGNLIARSGDGRARRRVARSFVKAVGDAIRGTAPWTPTPLFEVEALQQWLAEFPDHASQGRSFGDLSIIKEYERQCALHPWREVFIWSLDRHLASYRRAARRPRR